MAFMSGIMERRANGAGQRFSFRQGQETPDDIGRLAILNAQPTVCGERFLQFHAGKG